LGATLGLAGKGGDDTLGEIAGLGLGLASGTLGASEGDAWTLMGGEAAVDGTDRLGEALALDDAAGAGADADALPLGTFTLADPPQGDLRGSSELEGLVVDAHSLGGRPRHARFDKPRCHSVDVHVVRPELDRERARHPLQAHLRRRIVSLPAVAQR